MAPRTFFSPRSMLKKAIVPGTEIQVNANTLKVKRDLKVNVAEDANGFHVRAQEELRLFVTGLGDTYHEALADLMQIAVNVLQKTETRTPLFDYLELKKG